MKKQWICFLLLVTFILGITSIALADMELGGIYVYTANGKSLNLRSAPVTNANNKIGSIPYGAKVQVDSYVNDNQWAYVQYNGQSGYVMARYLTSHYPGDKPTTPSSSGDSSSSSGSSSISYQKFVQVDYYVTVQPSTPGGFVHMRWAPSKQDDIYANYYAGASLEVIAQNDSWAQVRDPETGKVGFMMRSFLK